MRIHTIALALLQLAEKIAACTFFSVTAIIGNELGNKICVGDVYARRGRKNFCNRVVEISVVWQTKLPSLLFRRVISEKLDLAVGDGAKYLAACQILSQSFKNSSQCFFS